MPIRFLELVWGLEFGICQGTDTRCLALYEKYQGIFKFKLLLADWTHGLMSPPKDSVLIDGRASEAQRWTVYRRVGNRTQTTPLKGNYTTSELSYHATDLNLHFFHSFRQVLHHLSVSTNTLMKSGHKFNHQVTHTYTHTNTHSLKSYSQLLHFALRDDLIRELVLNWTLDASGSREENK